MKRVILFIILLIGFGCNKSKTPVTPNNTTTNTTTPQSPKVKFVLGDTLIIQLDSCQKVIDTLKQDTLTICLDSIYDLRDLIPLCDASDPPGNAKCFFIFQNTISLNMEIACQGVNKCGYQPNWLFAPNPTFIDTLGYRICLVGLLPNKVDSTLGVFPSNIPDSLYKAMVIINKN